MVTKLRTKGQNSISVLTKRGFIALATKKSHHTWKAQVLSLTEGFKGQQQSRVHYTNGEDTSQEKAASSKVESGGPKKEEIDRLRDVIIYSIL